MRLFRVIRIKKVRKSLDLTQEAFATRIGSVQNTITGYESGRRNPSAPVISLICKEFNVNEEWLRNGTGEMFNQEPCDELDSLADKFNLSHGEYIFLEKYFTTMFTNHFIYFHTITSKIFQQNLDSINKILRFR